MGKEDRRMSCMMVKPSARRKTIDEQQRQRQMMIGI